MPASKTNTILLIALIVAVLAAGGGVTYALLRQSDDNTQTQEVSETQASHSEADTTAPAADQSQSPVAGEGDQTIDGVVVPAQVLNEIERDYPDYVIDDADRETHGGTVYYEIDLDHRDPANDSEYELTYDASWRLVDVEFDES